MDELSVVIQAGGESRRMGRDKGLTLFLGQPLAGRVAERLRPVAGEILLTTNRPQEYTFLGIPLFPDLLPGRGALSGLYTALSAARRRLVAVVACDMPFVNPRLLEAQALHMQATQADLVIPHTGEGLEPFHAIYRRETCLPHIQVALEAEKWRVDAWFSQVKVEFFRQEDILRYDPEMRSFWNVNTPEELQAAEKLASS